MSKEINIEMRNSKELLKLFDELTEKNQKKIGLNAIRKSAKLILDTAKSYFKSSTKGFSKTGYKDILSSFKTKGMKNKIGLVVGVEGYNQKRGNYGVYKASWLNYGTKERSYVNKGGTTHRTGKLEATNFFSNAVRDKTNEAQSTISNNLIISLENLVKKYNK